MERFLLEHIRVGLVLTLFTPLLVGRFGFSFGEYPKALFFGVLVEILLIAYLFLLLKNKAYLPRNTFLLWLAVGFVVLQFVSGIFGFNFERSLWGDMDRSESLVLYAHFLAYFVILSGVVKTQKAWTILFRWAAGVSVPVATVGFLQKFGVVDLYSVSGSSPAGTFTNTAFYASWLVMVIFLGIFLFGAEPDWRKKAVWGTVTLVNGILLLLTFSLGAWIGAGAGAALLVLIKGGKVFWGSVVLFLLILSAAFFFFWAPIQTDIIDSAEVRLTVWSIAFEAWQERPLLGWGLESFSYVFELERPESLSSLSAFFDRPHSKPVELLHNSGLAGFLAYAAIFSLAWWRLARPARPLLSSWARLALAALLLAYFAQNAFLFDTVSTYLLFFLLLAFLNNSVMPQTRFAFWIPRFRVPRAVPFAAALAATGGIVALLYAFHLQPLQLNLLMVRATSFEPENVGQALSYYQKIFQKKGLYADDFKVFITERTLSYFNADWARPGRTQMLGLFSEAEPVLKEKLRYPDKTHRNYYALLMGISEKRYDMLGMERFLKEAEDIANQALLTYSNNAGFHRALGQIYILEGEYEKGEGYFKQAFAMTTDEFPERHQITFFKSLGGAYFRAGNKERAAESFKKALDAGYAWAKTSPVLPVGSYLPTGFTDEIARFYAMELNDPETALEIYDHAIEVYPSPLREWFQERRAALVENFF